MHRESRKEAFNMRNLKKPQRCIAIKRTSAWGESRHRELTVGWAGIGKWVHSN